MKTKEVQEHMLTLLHANENKYLLDLQNYPLPHGKNETLKNLIFC